MVPAGVQTTNLALLAATDSSTEYSDTTCEFAAQSSYATDGKYFSNAYGVD